jgi:hypothetical protein
MARYLDLDGLPVQARTRGPTCRHVVPIIV